VQRRSAAAGSRDWTLQHIAGHVQHKQTHELWQKPLSTGDFILHGSQLSLSTGNFV
jgi:hypothetical protein